jgi:hypothetical protein
MRNPVQTVKDRLACLALLYALKGQAKKSERLRRIVRRIEHLDPPAPALAN